MAVTSPGKRMVAAASKGAWQWAWQLLNRYGSAEDPKPTEEWTSCLWCMSWYHDSCAEDSGVMDDDGTFTCAECL